MKQRVITILAAVGLLALLGAAASTFVTQNLVVQQTSNLAVATASSVGLTGTSTAPLITQCNASPPTGATAKGSICLDPTNGTPFVYNGTAWAAIGGGGVSQWTAGSKSSGTLVYDGACSFLFAATATTSTEPCWDLGNGTTLVWTRNSVFSASNGQVIFTNGCTSCAANIISNSTFPDWRDRELIVDVNISGNADALGFGIFDGSASSTQTGALVTGSYGVELDFFNSQVQTVTNGVITPGSQIPVRAGMIKNDGVGITFDRYYLDFHDNGNSTMNVTLWRNHQNTTTTDNPYGPCDQCFGAASALKRDKWAGWTMAIPAYTAWKFIVGSRSGGLTGQTIVNKIQARDVPGFGAWKSVSTLPDL